MTRRSESRKEAAMPTPLLTPKATTLFGTWNVGTMYEEEGASGVGSGTLSESLPAMSPGMH